MKKLKLDMFGAKEHKDMIMQKRMQQRNDRILPTFLDLYLEMQESIKLIDERNNQFDAASPRESESQSMISATPKSIFDGNRKSINFVRDMPTSTTNAASTLRLDDPGMGAMVP